MGNGNNKSESTQEYYTSSNFEELVKDVDTANKM